MYTISVRDEFPLNYFLGDPVPTALPVHEIAPGQVRRGTYPHTSAVEVPCSRRHPGYADTAQRLLSGEIIIANTGDPLGVMSIDMRLEANSFEDSATDGGTVLEAGVTWLNQPIPPTNFSKAFIFTTQVSDDRQDRNVVVTATVMLGGYEISQPFTVKIDSDRSETSNSTLWLTLILLFVVLGFGAVCLLTRDGLIMGKGVGAIAGVLCILAAILILAFGLDLANETTLALIGSIAGYVFGQWAFDASDSKIINSMKEKMRS